MIESFLVHVITVKRRTSIGPKGDPVYGGDAFEVRARVEKTRRLIRKGGGKELVSSFSIATLAKIEHDDLIWLPAILGEPADDITRNDAARSPATVEFSTDRGGKRGFYQTFL